jgi:hypothetical protein
VEKCCGCGQISESEELKHSAISRKHTEWVTKTSTDVLTQDPPRPEEFATEMRQNQTRYTEFADRMIRAVHGKSRYSAATEITLFDALISKSQEAFTLLLYENGYKNWMWAWTNRQDSTSDTSGDDHGGASHGDCPACACTTKRQDFTTRGGVVKGWNAKVQRTV